MGYVDDNLITAETVTYRARLHWCAFFFGFLGGSTLAVLGVLMMVWSFGEHQDSIPRGTIGLVLLLVGSSVEVAVVIKKAGTELAVTNKRVILKTGIVQRKTTELFLNKIESVEVEQTVTGRILGFGTVRLQGTGGSSEPVAMVSRPLEFRRQVHEQIGRLPMEGRSATWKGLGET